MNDTQIPVTCYHFIFELGILHVVIIRHLNMESFTNIIGLATSGIKILGNSSCLQSIERHFFKKYLFLSIIELYIKKIF